MRTIPLTQGRIVFVDDEDYALVEKYKWFLRRGRNGNCYAVANTGGGRKKTTSLLMHRFLLRLRPHQHQVDHINGCGLDNQRHNLRVASHAENQRNRKCTQTTGVRFRMNRNRWEAHISVNDKQLYLGQFSTFATALAARVAAEQKYFGEFAPRRDTKDITQ
jgi:hypothetical protein